jgi:hypothetical protein
MKLEDMALEARYLLTIDAGVATPLLIAEHGSVARRMVPVTEGTVTGRVSGRLTAGGADWQYVNESGVTDVEARYCLELEGGDVVEVQSSGVRTATPDIVQRMFAGEQLDPDQYYFRTGIKIRTSSARYEWLTRFICVGIATRQADRVIIRVFEIL